MQRAALQFLILSVLLISSLPPPLVIMSFITMSTNDVDDIVKIITTIITATAPSVIIYAD